MLEKLTQHFRTWKSGKIWLFSAGVLLMLAITGTSLSVHADDVSQMPAQGTPTSISATVNDTPESSSVLPSSSIDSGTSNAASPTASDASIAPNSRSSETNNTADAAPTTETGKTDSSTAAQGTSPQSSANVSELTKVDSSSKPTTTPVPAANVSSETSTTANVTTQSTATVAQIGTTSDNTASTPSSQNFSSAITQKKAPEITNIQVSGAVDNNATGATVFDGVNITLQGQDITDDNLLSPEGLHWSGQTQIVVIKGTATGQLSQSNFGTQNGPIAPATTYSINDGDSGRITYVGKTLSGIDLDMIYTVASSDQDTWKANEGDDGTLQGVAFTGEQNIADSGGDSIVCLYNGANALSLIYQIVKHDTTTEVPVIASFITTDIDVAQGVQSNLANLVTILPQTTNLKQDGDTIYDASANYPDLNGVASLPYGGYLGAGFVSEFYYNYYAPAPERAKDSYFFAQGVRYDLFGSALQAHMNTQIRQNITINYLDEFGHKIAPTDYYLGFTNQDYNLPIPTYPNYSFVSMTENDDKQNSPVVNLVYQPKPYIYNQKNNNEVSYAGVNYQPNITFNYQNEGYANSTVTYTPQNSQTAEPIVIPLTWKPAQVDIVTPDFKTISYDTSKYDNTNNTGLSETQLSNFEKNLGFNRNESIAVIDYMNEVANEAKMNHQDVNHAVDNALAYSSYHYFGPGNWNNFQPFYNDFGNVLENSNVDNILEYYHKNSTQEVDLPHLATDLAATENTSFPQTLLQRIMIFPYTFSSKQAKENIVLQQDGLAGDLLSNIGLPDYYADMDAETFFNSPDWKNKSRDKQIVDYYTQSPKKLQKERAKQAKKTSKVINGSGVLAMVSIAGVLIFGVEELRRKWNIVKTVFNSIKNGVKSLIKTTGNLLKKIKNFFTGDPVQADTVTIKNTSTSKPIKSATNSLSTLKNQASKVFNQGVKSVSKVFTSFVNTAKAAGQNAKSFLNQNVKMAQKSLNTAIQVAKEAAKKAAERARQAASWVGQNIRNAGNAVWNGLKSTYNTVSSFVGNVYNNYVAPVVNTVTRTVSNFVNSAVKVVSNVVHSVVNTVKSVASKVVNTVKK
ncbi:MAG: MucBP domain-containing protein, partial [Lactococcus hircilactis]